MPTAHAANYELFNPAKKVANKAIALRIATNVFDGKVIDNATIDTSQWGVCHVAAYTDLLGAMIATTDTDVQFGDLDWHSKEKIILVREHPKKGKSPARITIYVCKIKDLFENKSVGYSGVKWEDVSKVKLFGKTFPSSNFLENKNENDA